jgi:hypothetical protein
MRHAAECFRNFTGINQEISENFVETPIDLIIYGQCAILVGKKKEEHDQKQKNTIRM